MNRLALLLLAASAWAATLRADPPLLVGPLGDVAGMEFRGNDTFSTQNLQTTLGCQLELLPAAHNLASLSRLLEVVRELLQRGYRGEGFADVAIDARFDEQQQAIVVTIEEGPRYREGDVHIAGAEGTLEKLLRDAILEGIPPDDATLVATHISDGVVIGEWRNPQGQLAQRTPLWGKNKDHVLLSQARLKGTQAKLKEVLEQQGYTRPALDVNFVPGPDHTIALHVDVRDPGTAVEITEVTVEGAKRNAHESIRDLIDIHAGDGWTLARKMLAERRLKTCGRFLHGDVSLVPGTANPSAGTVLVRVRECDLVPSLDEPLTPDDQVLMRCAEWLESLPHDDLDVVIEAQFELRELPDRLAVPVGPVNLRLAISPGSGLLIESTIAGLSDQPLRYVAMSNPQRLSLHSARTRSRYDIAFDNAPVLSANFSIAGIPEAVSKEQTSQLAYGLSLNRDDRPYCPVQFSINPAVFLSDSRREGVVCQRADGQVVFRGSQIQAQIEEATGRLVSLEVVVEDFGQFRISTEAGAFDRICSELDQQTAQGQNVADPQRPFSSAVEFIAAEVTAVANDLGQDELAAQIGTWQSLLVSQLVPRLDALFERWESSDDVFMIPPPDPESALQTHWAASMFLQANALLFAHDAGPGVLGRELAAALLLRDAAALKRSLRIGQSTSTGPVTCWYAAEALRFVAPELGQVFAQFGLKRLETRHLRNDLREVLKGESLVGTALRDTAVALRETPPEQLEQLFRFLPQREHRTALLEAVSHLTNDTDEAVMRTCEVLWEACGRDIIKRRLQILAQPPAPAEVVIR